MDTVADGARTAMGFLTRVELEALEGVTVLDPASALVGRDVRIGPGSVLYPGVVLETSGGGSIDIGSGVTLGPGGVTVLAAPGTTVSIGDGARLRGGAWVEGPADIGAGAQLLGTVQVRDVVLGGGGAFDEPDPDRRGGVVKGTGRLHGARVGVGEVVELGRGGYAVERQRAHHPGAPGGRAAS